MSIQSPYLQRRGDTFSFRISVPSELRPIVGKREFIKSLQTADKRIAVVKALRLAATAKQLFNELKGNMTKPNNAGKTSLKSKEQLIRDDGDRLEEGDELSIGYRQQNLHQCKKHSS